MLYKESYKEFLAQVGKHRVGTVLPTEYAIVYNNAVEEVVTNKLSAMEMNKRMTDDLLALVKTSSVETSVIKSDEPTSYVLFERDASIRRVKRLSVTLNNAWNAKCSFLKANEASDTLFGFYSGPSIKQTYYNYVTSDNGIENIKLFIPQKMQKVRLLIEYYTEPIRVDDTVVISSDPCQFRNETMTEIINTAARIYLERNQDARYQTISVEQKHKVTNQ